MIGGSSNQLKSGQETNIFFKTVFPNLTFTSTLPFDKGESELVCTTRIFSAAKVAMVSLQMNAVLLSVSNVEHL